MHLMFLFHCLMPSWNSAQRGYSIYDHCTLYYYYITGFGPYDSFIHVGILYI